MKETTTKERPIIFTAESVRAILDGTKTMTRRVCNIQPELIDGLWHVFYGDWDAGHGIYESEAEMFAEFSNVVKCPYGKIGDRLYVRETWRPDYTEDDILYRSDGEVRRFLDQSEWFEGDYLSHAGKDTLRWRPSIHQPRWASRITLEITDVRVERLQDITVNDVWAEGVEMHPPAIGAARQSIERKFGKAWDAINGKTHPWESNPWVWCLSFQRVK